MRFRVEREALADAVTWIARGLPGRPQVPILAGALFELAGERLTLSAYDHESYAQITVDTLAEPGAANVGRLLVSGRLLVEITKVLPEKPVEFLVEGASATVSCGSAWFTLPTLPVEDYPERPTLPAVVGAVPARALATAVAQVAGAAGRNDAVPMLTGVHLEFGDELISLVATDNYRMAVRELAWTPAPAGVAAQPSAEPAAALVPARALLDTVRAFAAVNPSGDVTIALPDTGDGVIGFAGDQRHTTTRLLDARFPHWRTRLAITPTSTAELPLAGLVEAVRRVALVTDGRTPVRLEFGGGHDLSLRAAGADEGRAGEQLDVAFTGQPLTVGFNPGYLLDGLTAMRADTVRMSFTSPTKGAMLSPAGGADTTADYRYVLMPMHLTD